MALPRDERSGVAIIEDQANRVCGLELQEARSDTEDTRRTNALQPRANHVLSSGRRADTSRLKQIPYQYRKGLSTEVVGPESSHYGKFWVISD